MKSPLAATFMFTQPALAVLAEALQAVKDELARTEHRNDEHF
jgi:hypothetical protein